MVYAVIRFDISSPPRVGTVDKHEHVTGSNADCDCEFCPVSEFFHHDYYRHSYYSLGFSVDAGQNSLAGYCLVLAASEIEIENRIGCVLEIGTASAIQTWAYTHRGVRQRVHRDPVGAEAIWHRSPF
jgi:hypothetical protein